MVKICLKDSEKITAPNFRHDLQSRTRFRPCRRQKQLMPEIKPVFFEKLLRYLQPLSPHLFGEMY